MDYDAAAVDGVAQRLTTMMTLLAADRARLAVSPGSDFTGDAADKFYAHLSRQAVRIDAVIGDLARAIAVLRREAADIRAEQHQQRLIDLAKARAAQQSSAKGPL